MNHELREWQNIRYCTCGEWYLDQEGWEALEVEARAAVNARGGEGWEHYQDVLILVGNEFLTHLPGGVKAQ